MERQYSPWQDIKATARFSGANCSFCPGFEKQSEPRFKFRPGQVFAAQITSGFILKHNPTFRDIDFGNLPLESIPTLKARAQAEQLEDRFKRLAQIHQLPLENMTRYCEDVPSDGKKVYCLLCSNPKEQTKWPKDKWATWHFRKEHWIYYFSMVPGLSDHLSREMKGMVISQEKQSEEPPQPPDQNFSAEKWITLEDVTLDTPITEDNEMANIVENHSLGYYFFSVRGPVMIQRFVVVREGSEQCLALGIHTLVKSHVRSSDCQ